MTRQQSFKERVRARMEKTGERYTTARAQLLGTLGDGGRPSPGHPFRPGLCRDTAATANLLAALDVRLGEGGPAVDEVLLTGLSGGTGFLYIVFEYQGTPPLPSVLMRHDTAADQFVLHGLRRLGIGLEVHETTSARRARATLDGVLDGEAAALCVVDAAALLDPEAEGPTPGMAPTQVVVTGREGDGYRVDTGLGGAVVLSAAALARARAGFRKGKHRLVEVTDARTTADVAGALHGAAAATADRYVNAPFKGFASSFGLAGMEKLVAALTDDKGARGWPRLFPEGRLACLGLRRLYEGIQLEMTPPAGGRWEQARFLRGAARLTGHRAYEGAADAFDAAAAGWGAVASFVADCGVRGVATGCELLDAYAELLDSGASHGAAREARRAVEEASDAAELPAARARELYGQVAGLVSAAVDAERAAVEALTRATQEVSR